MTSFLFAPPLNDWEGRSTKFQNLISSIKGTKKVHFLGMFGRAEKSRF